MEGRDTIVKLRQTLNEARAKIEDLKMMRYSPEKECVIEANIRAAMFANAKQTRMGKVSTLEQVLKYTLDRVFKVNDTYFNSHFEPE